MSESKLINSNLHRQPHPQQMPASYQAKSYCQIPEFYKQEKTTVIINNHTHAKQYGGGESVTAIKQTSKHNEE